MDVSGSDTHFAPAERDPPEIVRDLHQALRGHFIADTVNAIPVIVLLLNARRQVVLANEQTLKAINVSMDDVLGKRPGEAFGCVYADAGPGGCGTSKFCTRCGAVRSILAGLEGHKSIQECSLLRGVDKGVEALDLQVSSSPITVEGHCLVLFTVQDVSDFKRRRTLEKLFFHDILNTAGGLRGLTELLSHEAPPGLADDAAFIHSVLSQMVEELLSQKDLLAAENNELEPTFGPLKSLDVLNSLVRFGASLAQAKGKNIRLDQAVSDVTFVSDATLLRRVLGNMIKNALEASKPGEFVTLDCRQAPGGLVFEVRNPAVMSEEVRLNLFKRNFSTKGKGRGLGVYGMRLLSQRYLGGQISFESAEPRGTVFRLHLPLDPDHPVSAPPVKVGD